MKLKIILVLLIMIIGFIQPMVTNTSDTILPLVDGSKTTSTIEEKVNESQNNSPVKSDSVRVDFSFTKAYVDIEKIEFINQYERLGDTKYIQDLYNLLTTSSTLFSIYDDYEDNWTKGELILPIYTRGLAGTFYYEYTITDSAVTVDYSDSSVALTAGDFCDAKGYSYFSFYTEHKNRATGSTRNYALRIWNNTAEAYKVIDTATTTTAWGAFTWSAITIIDFYFTPTTIIEHIPSYATALEGGKTSHTLMIEVFDYTTTATIFNPTSWTYVTVNPTATKTTSGLNTVLKGLVPKVYEVQFISTCTTVMSLKEFEHPTMKSNSFEGATYNTTDWSLSSCLTVSYDYDIVADGEISQKVVKAGTAEALYRHVYTITANDVSLRGGFYFSFKYYISAWTISTSEFRVYRYGGTNSYEYRIIATQSTFTATDRWNYYLIWVNALGTTHDFQLYFTQTASTITIYLDDFRLYQADSEITQLEKDKVKVESTFRYINGYNDQLATKIEARQRLYRSTVAGMWDTEITVTKVNAGYTDYSGKISFEYAEALYQESYELITFSPISTFKDNIVDRLSDTAEVAASTGTINYTESYSSTTDILTLEFNRSALSNYIVWDSITSWSCYYDTNLIYGQIKSNITTHFITQTYSYDSGTDYFVDTADTTFPVANTYYEYISIPRYWREIKTNYNGDKYQSSLGTTLIGPTYVPQKLELFNFDFMSYSSFFFTPSVPHQVDYFENYYKELSFDGGKRDAFYGTVYSSGHQYFVNGLLQQYKTRTTENYISQYFYFKGADVSTIDWTTVSIRIRLNGTSGGTWTYYWALVDTAGSVTNPTVAGGVGTEQTLTTSFQVLNWTFASGKTPSYIRGYVKTSDNAYIGSVYIDWVRLYKEETSQQLDCGEYGYFTSTNNKWETIVYNDGIQMGYYSEPLSLGFNTTAGSHTFTRDLWARSDLLKKAYVSITSIDSLSYESITNYQEVYQVQYVFISSYNSLELNADKYLLIYVNDRLVSAGFETTLETYNLTIRDRFGNVLYNNPTENQVSYKQFSLALRPFLCSSAVDRTIGIKILQSGSLTGNVVTADIPSLSSVYVYLFDGNYYLVAGAYDNKIDDYRYYHPKEYSISCSSSSAYQAIYLEEFILQEFFLDITSIEHILQITLISFLSVYLLVIVIVAVYFQMKNRQIIHNFGQKISSIVFPSKKSPAQQGSVKNNTSTFVIRKLLKK